MPVMRPMTKAEEDASQGPVLDVGRYYPGTVQKVDFFRNKEGRIVGGRPTPVKDGKCSKPNGQIKLVIFVKLDEFPEQETLVTMPFPWNDEVAPPWDGPKENGLPVFVNDNGKTVPSGKANTFSDEDVAKYMRPIRTGGNMPNKISKIAGVFGWSPFIIDGKGEPVAQELDLDILMRGKRVHVGRIQKGEYVDTEILPLNQTKKPTDKWVGEMFEALKGVTMKSGVLFTSENVCKALGINDNILTPADYEKIAPVLESSLVDREILVPSPFEGAVPEKKSGGL